MLEQGAEIAIWVGIIFCASQSALFSGMNLAMFSLSRLRLEVEVSSGNTAAAKMLEMRQDSHFLLTTILWGNVSINVLLTLLSDSVLTGVGAFLFSAVVITVFGEIAPQAYFSRNALKVALVLSPLLRFYQILLYPVAKPCARLLDLWLGEESIQYFREHNLRELIRKHIDSPEGTDIDRLEGLGALNFLSLDDLPVVAEGEPVDPASIVPLPWRDGAPVFPEFSASVDDAFVRAVEVSGKKWVIITDEQGEPKLVLDTDRFLRHLFFQYAITDAMHFCHQPIVVQSRSTPLGWVLSRLRYVASGTSDQVNQQDVILLWADTKRVVTGSDILGRLMEGIADHPTTAE